MKSKIFVAVLLLIITGMSSFANSNLNFPTTREVSITGSFEKIVVEKNFQVVLVQYTGKSSVTVSGDQKNILNVEVNVVNDQLIISTKKNANAANIIVYVPVKNVSLIKLASGASVSGEGVLKFDNLTVIVNTDSHVDLKALGNIIIQPADGCDLVYEKNERYKVIYQ